MHDWSDEGFDWESLNDACDYLQYNCIRYARFGVWTKEKYGVLRVSTTCAYFGEWPIHNLVKPGHVAYRWPGWIMLYIDRPLGTLLRNLGITWIINKYQTAVFKYFWIKAAKKWPHIRDEILAEFSWYFGE